MSIREELPEGHMAEIIQFPGVPVQEPDRLAELDAKIKVAFDALHELIAEKADLEDRLAA